MLAAAARYLPATRNYLRQIVPPVLATLIAALLIAGFNRAFTTHLVQPRMAALHSNSDEAVPPAGNAVKPREAVEIVTVTEPAAPERVFVKDNEREAGKDQTPIKIAAPAATPVPAAAAAPSAAPHIAVRKAEPPILEQRIEPRLAAVPVVVAPSVMAAPLPPAAPPVMAQPLQPVAPAMQPAPMMQPVAPMMQPVAQAPPPVITAKPMVTVPDRARPAYEPQAGEQDLAQAPPPRQESFVEALRPSSIFNRMREFGERIEAAGNEILPTIRQ